MRLHQSISRILTGVADLLYPPLCAGCGQLLDGTAGFCPDCRRQLLDDPWCTCRRCGSTVGEHVDTTDGCGQCRDRRFAFEQVVRLGTYDGLRRDLIVRMKRDEVLAERVGTAFAEGIVGRLGNTPIDGVIPVPLHWRRRWQRGYNQSDALATELADALQVAHWSSLLRRTRDTPHQVGLVPTSRKENVRGAFAVRRRVLAGKSVVLVDDVFTTGATVDAAARALKGAGVARVIVAVAAHG